MPWNAGGPGECPGSLAMLRTSPSYGATSTAMWLLAINCTSENARRMMSNRAGPANVGGP